MSEEMQDMRLSEQAAADFARGSAEEREARRRELEDVAARFTSPVELYEGGLAVTILGLLAGILFLAFGIFGEAKEAVGRVMIIVCGVAAIAGAASLLAGRNKAVLTLTPTGVLFRGSDRELPWGDVDDLTVSSFDMLVRMSTAIVFQLADGVEPPALSGRRRTKYLKRKGQIHVQTMQFQGFNDRKLLEMLENAHDAGAARAMLKEMR